jgi:hypothetical protein
MFIKISHNRLKKCQTVARMLCGTPKTRQFSAFLSHFSKIIFEKRLFRQSQRFALVACGRGWILLGIRIKLEASKMLACTLPQAQVKMRHRIPTVHCTWCSATDSRNEPLS